jgi:hypothetical protein
MESRHARLPRLILVTGDQCSIDARTPLDAWRGHCGPLILLSVFNNVEPGVSPDSGLAGCTALSDTHQVAATKYPRIRAEFTGSRWPDLRAAGTSYMELVIKLRRPQYTDGYETVWFYQRLSAACAKHGRALNAGI